MYFVLLLYLCTHHHVQYMHHMVITAVVLLYTRIRIIYSYKEYFVQQYHISPAAVDVLMLTLPS